MKECAGVVKKISLKMNVARTTVYDILDEDLDLAELRIKFSRRFDHDTYETAQEVLDKMLDLADENPELASKNSQFVLKNSKVSTYNNEVNKNSNDNDMDAAKDLTKDIETQIEDDKAADPEAKQ